MENKETLTKVDIYSWPLRDCAERKQLMSRLGE